MFIFYILFGYIFGFSSTRDEMKEWMNEWIVFTFRSFFLQNFNALKCFFIIIFLLLALLLLLLMMMGKFWCYVFIVYFLLFLMNLIFGSFWSALSINMISYYIYIYLSKQILLGYTRQKDIGKSENISPTHLFTFHSKIPASDNE